MIDTNYRWKNQTVCSIVLKHILLKFIIRVIKYWRLERIGFFISFFVIWFGTSTLPHIYHADVIVEYVFVYKNLQFLIVKLKWAYLSEFLFPRELRNICYRANAKLWENEKKLKFWQLQKIRNIYILYIRFEGL